MIELTKAELLNQLAEAWNRGHLAGWGDAQSTENRRQGGYPDLNPTPNPYELQGWAYINAARKAYCP